MQFDDVFVADDVVLLYVLTAITICAPDSCELKFVRQLSVNGDQIRNGLVAEEIITMFVLIIRRWSRLRVTESQLSFSAVSFSVD